MLTTLYVPSKRAFTAPLVFAAIAAILFAGACATARDPELPRAEAGSA